MRTIRPSGAVSKSLRWIAPSKVNRPRPFHTSPSIRCSCSKPAVKDKIDDHLTTITSDSPTPAADHRVIGKKLNLFSGTIYSPGSPLFHPDGAHIFHKLQAFLRAQYPTFGIQEVITPTIYKQSLWEQSGHWANYKDDMFEVTGRGASGGTDGSKKLQPNEDEKYGLKPMNCPGHCLLFKSETRSYKSLPIRYADFSPLHRNEISGALSGLTRVRRFHQDDGHIFCRPIQVGQEIESTLQLVEVVYKTLGLPPYKLVLSTRPKDNFMGSIKEWDRAEAQLRDALEKSGREWKTHEGDGAFYGPKIDIMLQDSDGKEHQTATIQLDFQLPKSFNLHYKAPAPELEAQGVTTTDPVLLQKSGDVRPVIIHRAVLGSLERFMALLIEHYKGFWPFWLSPRQAIILTVGADANIEIWARKVAQKLAGTFQGGSLKPNKLGDHMHKIETDFSQRGLGAKVKDARSRHFNMVCVIGPNDERDETITVDFTGQPSLVETALPFIGKRLGLDGKVALTLPSLALLMDNACEAYL